jgi:beta-N-acetylhexosaminidase
MADRVPQPFLLGIYGIEPTEETVRLLRESGAAGIYLLRRNIETAEQVRTLIASLEAELGYRLLVAIDHEGGLVYRFTRGVTFFPGNAALGQTATPALAYEVARFMGRELAGMGVNVNLAPVLDLAGDGAGSDLALRSFGKDPALVSTLGAQMIRGFQEAGVAATARHFPGRGAAAGPPGEPPVVKGDREGILGRDVAPFRAAVAGGASAVMTANAFYPALDPEVPALMSGAVVTELLRRQLGFAGVAVTEDLSSPAALGRMSIEEGVVRALQAGNDLVLLASDYDLAKRALRGYKLAVDSARLSKDSLAASQARVSALLARRPPRSAPPADEAEEAEGASALAGIVAGAAIKVEVDPQKLLPLDPRIKAGILVPRLWDVADRIAIDDELRGAASLVQGWIQSASTTAEVLEIPVQPEGDMLTLTLDWAAGLDVAVFFSFDAQRYSGQKKLLEEMQRRCPKVVLVTLRNPADRALATGRTTVVNPFGFRVCQLSAAVGVLFAPNPPPKA